MLGQRRGTLIKNAVDVKMAVDAVSLMSSLPHIDVYVIVSGDRDFIHPEQADPSRSGSLRDTRDAWFHDSANRRVSVPTGECPDWRVSPTFILKPGVCCAPLPLPDGRHPLTIRQRRVGKGVPWSGPS